MYKSSSFYLSTIAASTITFLFYPIIVSITSFWMLGIDNSSFLSFLDWTAIVTLEAICGFTFGLMLGTIINQENSAISINLLFAMLFSFGGGMYANTGDNANYLIRAISYVSPIRFSSELLMRRIMN